MNQSRIATVASSLVCMLLLTGSAYAQVGSTCLKPLAITDKWIEAGSPPWDPTDTFDPTSGDVYLPEAGWDPAVDHGQPLQLSQYVGGLVSSQSMLTVQFGDFVGNKGFLNNLAGCSGWRYGLGDSLRLASGITTGPLTDGIEGLIEQDPTAF